MGGTRSNTGSVPSTDVSPDGVAPTTVLGLWRGSITIPWRCKQIIRALTDRCGPDGFDYLMPLKDLGATLIGGDILRIDGDVDFDE